MGKKIRKENLIWQTIILITNIYSRPNFATFTCKQIISGKYMMS